MKKFLSILALVVIVILFAPQNVFAKQGCCSHHGGVSHCGSSGYYVCNDGSRSPSCTCGYVAPAPVVTQRPIVITPRPATPKPTTQATTVPTPTETPTSTPEVLGVGVVNPTATPVAEVLGTKTEDNPVASLVGLGVFIFGGYKGLKWLARKTAPTETV